MRAEGYADVVFAVNLAMDFFLLSAAGAVLRIRRRVRRRLFGAAVAALAYCALAFGLPAPGWWSLPLGAGVLALGLAAAFCPVPPGLFAKLMATAYILAFATGGVMNALAALSGPENAGATWALLIGGTAVSYILLQLTRRFLRRNDLQRQMLCAVAIHLDGRCAHCDGLVDTGSTLHDPITHAPVLVAEFAALQSLLPAPVAQIFLNKQEDNLPALLTGFRAGCMETRLRMLPFTSVGAANGMLIGFRTDMVVFTTDSGQKSTLQNTVVGISLGALGGGKYNALINPSMLGLSEKEV